MKAMSRVAGRLWFGIIRRGRAFRRVLELRLTFPCSLNSRIYFHDLKTHTFHPLRNMNSSIHVKQDGFRALLQFWTGTLARGLLRAKLRPGNQKARRQPGRVPFKRRIPYFNNILAFLSPTLIPDASHCLHQPPRDKSSLPKRMIYEQICFNRQPCQFCA